MKIQIKLLNLFQQSFCKFLLTDGIWISVSFINKYFANLTEENGIHFATLIFSSLCFSKVNLFSYIFVHVYIFSCPLPIFSSVIAWFIRAISAENINEPSHELWMFSFYAIVFNICLWHFGCLKTFI